MRNDGQIEIINIKKGFYNGTHLYEQVNSFDLQEIAKTPSAETTKLIKLNFYGLDNLETLCNGNSISSQSIEIISLSLKSCPKINNLDALEPENFSQNCYIFISDCDSLFEPTSNNEVPILKFLERIIEKVGRFETSIAPDKYEKYAKVLNSIGEILARKTGISEAKKSESLAKVSARKGSASSEGTPDGLEDGFEGEESESLAKVSARKRSASSEGTPDGLGDGFEGEESEFLAKAGETYDYDLVGRPNYNSSTQFSQTPDNAKTNSFGFLKSRSSDLKVTTTKGENGSIITSFEPGVDNNPLPPVPDTIEKFDLKAMEGAASAHPSSSIAAKSGITSGKGSANLQNKYSLKS